jgi:hypothetical protein
MTTTSYKWELMLSQKTGYVHTRPLIKKAIEKACAASALSSCMVIGTKFHLSMNNLVFIADLRLKLMIRRLLYYLQRSRFNYLAIPL